MPDEERTDQDPTTFTRLDEGAMRLHEWFLSLQRAGFTKGQAEHLVAESADDEYRRSSNLL